MDKTKLTIDEVPVLIYAKAKRKGSKFLIFHPDAEEWIETDITQAGTGLGSTPRPASFENVKNSIQWLHMLYGLEYGWKRKLLDYIGFALGQSMAQRALHGDDPTLHVTTTLEFHGIKGIPVEFGDPTLHPPTFPDRLTLFLELGLRDESLNWIQAIYAQPYRKAAEKKAKELTTFIQNVDNQIKLIEETHRKVTDVLQECGEFYTSFTKDVKAAMDVAKIKHTKILTESANAELSRIDEFIARASLREYPKHNFIEKLLSKFKEKIKGPPAILTTPEAHQPEEAQPKQQNREENPTVKFITAQEARAVREGRGIKVVG